MAEWIIVYQDAPYNYTTPASLVIEADDAEQALATAYDHLTRAGHVVGSVVPKHDGPGTPYREQIPERVDLEKLKTLLGANVNLDYMPGSTRIRACYLHQVSNLGTVLRR